MIQLSIAIVPFLILLSGCAMNKYSSTSSSYSSEEYPNGSLYSYRLLLKSAKDSPEARKQYTVEGECVNGQIEGAFRIVNKDGGPVVIGKLVAGQLDSVAHFFASSGDTVVSLNFQDGLLHGEVKMWYNPQVVRTYFGIPNAEGGHLKLVASYLNGELHGRKVHRIYSGKKRVEYEYERGVLKNAKGWSNYGQVHRSRAMHNAQKDDLADVRHYAGMIGIVNSLIGCSK